MEKHFWKGMDTSTPPLVNPHDSRIPHALQARDKFRFSNLPEQHQFSVPVVSDECGFNGRCQVASKYNLRKCLIALNIQSWNSIKYNRSHWSMLNASVMVLTFRSASPNKSLRGFQQTQLWNGFIGRFPASTNQATFRYARCYNTFAIFNIKH